nr:hypothetical protein [uncultured Desulfobulbus sp.]
MASEPKGTSATGWGDIISAVKTYLGFFVLIVLVAEAVFGAIALQHTGSTQLLAMAAMLAVIGLLISVVSFFAYRKPEALLRGIVSRQEGEALPTAAFCGQIVGYWWEWIIPEDASALSLVEVCADEASGTVKMKGRAFHTDGELVALWESIASCVNASEHKLFYYWKGWHPLHGDEPYEGFGEISFQNEKGILHRAVGFFSDTNLTDLKTTRKKTVELRRLSEQELQVASGDDRSAIKALIQQKLA